MKYIDAEKLKRFVGELKERAKRNRCDSWGIVPDALEEVEGFIASLQQEQPEVDLEKEIEEQINMYHNECEKKLNQMSDDDTDISFLTLNNFARHFYELGLNAGREESVSVAESPSKTFPRVNEFDCGGSYRH